MSGNLFIELYRTNAAVRVLGHTLAWLLFLFFPLLFAFNDWPQNFLLVIRQWLPLLFTIALFYINYFLLIEDYLFTRRTGLFLLINLALITLFLFSTEFLKDWIYPISPRRGGNPGSGAPSNRVAFLAYAISRNGFTMFLTVGASVAIRGMQRWIKSESERQHLENEHLHSELSHLHYQLQPHFFFNSLNNIYAMIDSAPESAKESIHGLSKLMRYLLYEAKSTTVSLQKELDFLQRFIDLMRIRLSDKVIVTSSFPASVPSVQIAPLLFVPLVENAFKHGVSATQASEIHIALTIDANTILFTTRNTFHPKSDDDKSGSGIGVENVKKRLRLLYPGKYEFHQEERDGFYHTTLKVSL